MLVKGPTADERALAAHKLCRAMDRDNLSRQELTQAHEILRLMAKDATELVRRALAITLKASPVLPRDVALKLARDVDSIATPVLNFSPAFSEEDLIDIARTGGAARQEAIAKRHNLPAAVASTLADIGCEEAVRLVCANDNAALGENAMQTAISRYEASQPVLTAIAYRKVLPISVTERLVNLVSEQVRRHLIENHAVSPAVAQQIAAAAGERAVIDLVDQAGRAGDMGAFVAHLNRNGRLTASLLLRALAQGQMSLFEWGISELAGVPHHRTWLMIHDAGPLGLKAIYERAGLPARLFPAFRSGVDTYHAMNADGAGRDKEGFQERMLQRFLTQPQQAPKEDVDYLLEKMDRLAATARAVKRSGGRTLN
ncbi:MAG: DUF2336 domain-containing protein [Caulobacteraceae bacterium]